jgi:hypothetical protein
VVSMNADGSDRKVIVTECRNPDSIVVDVEGGHIYWTNMGVPNLNDGSIERADIDGQNRKIIIPEVGTHTPKQLHLDKESGKLYWSDREGMRVMRSNLDGSKIETLVETSQGDARPGRDATKVESLLFFHPRSHLWWKGVLNAFDWRKCGIMINPVFTKIQCIVVGAVLVVVSALMAAATSGAFG